MALSVEGLLAAELDAAREELALKREFTAAVASGRSPAEAAAELTAEHAAERAYWHRYGVFESAEADDEEEFSVDGAPLDEGADDD